MNKTNLLKLADYLDTVQVSAFDMSDFARDEHHEFMALEAHECSSVACAIGHGPAAGIAISPYDNNCWLTYSRRVFGLSVAEEAWNWCFSGSWCSHDNTPAGAARRIRYLVEHGLPANAEDQRRGRVPYIFAKETA